MAARVVPSLLVLWCAVERGNDGGNVWAVTHGVLPQRSPSGVDRLRPSSHRVLQVVRMLRWRDFAYG